MCNGFAYVQVVHCDTVVHVHFMVYSVVLSLACIVVFMLLCVFRLRIFLCMCVFSFGSVKLYLYMCCRFVLCVYFGRLSEKKDGLCCMIACCMCLVFVSSLLS